MRAKLEIANGKRRRYWYSEGKSALEKDGDWRRAATGKCSNEIWDEELSVSVDDEVHSSGGDETWISVSASRS